MDAKMETKKDIGKLMIIGVGGAGCNMASTIRREAKLEAFRNAKYVFADKRESDHAPIVEEKDDGIYLNLWPVDSYNYFPPNFYDAIPSNFFHGIEKVYIVAGMGGNTGSKWVSIIASLVKCYNRSLTVIVSEPFLFEGWKKECNAKKGMKEFIQSNETLVSMSCEELICHCYGNITIFNAFLYADKAILTIIEEIHQTTNISGEEVVYADTVWMRYRFTQRVRLGEGVNLRV